MNKEQLKAAEKSALEEIERLKQRVKEYRASMSFLDRRDSRKIIAIGAAVVVVIVGLVVKFA